MMSWTSQWSLMNRRLGKACSTNLSQFCTPSCMHAHAGILAFILSADDSRKHLCG